MTYAMENDFLSSYLFYRKLKYIFKIYKTIIPVICTSMKLGLLHYGRVLQCIGEYLDLGGSGKEDCIMRSFIICGLTKYY